MSPGRLGQHFARELRHFPGRQKFVAVYEAYYDASETGAGPTAAVSLAVLIAPAAVWMRFSSAWDAAMARGGAEGKILHMADLVHGCGDFPGWKVAQQTPLFRRLIPVVRKHVSHGFCLSYPKFFWNQVMIIPSRRFSPSPLLELLHAAMEGIMQLAKPTASEPVHSYMEEDGLVEHDLTRHFYYLARIRGWEPILPTIKPLPKGPAPLQAADMVVYEGSRFVSEHVLSHSKRPARGLYRELEGIKQLRFKNLSLEAFKRHAVKSVLAGEQIRREPEIVAELDRHFAAAAKQTHRERTALGRERKDARRPHKQ